MTPEEQNIVVAEACGLIEIKLRPHPLDGSLILSGILPPKDYPIAVPDYGSDLNAMHEAEKVLTNVQSAKYANLLHTMILGTKIAGLHHNETCYFRTLHATAAQRREAFVRTIGKWRD